MAGPFLFHRRANGTDLLILEIDFGDGDVPFWELIDTVVAVFQTELHELLVAHIAKVAIEDPSHASMGDDEDILVGSFFF